MLFYKFGLPYVFIRSSVQEFAAAAELIHGLFAPVNFYPSSAPPAPPAPLDLLYQRMGQAPPDLLVAKKSQLLQRVENLFSSSSSTFPEISPETETIIFYLQRKKPNDVGYCD